MLPVQLELGVLALALALALALVLVPALALERRSSLVAAAKPHQHPAARVMVKWLHQFPG